MASSQTPVFLLSVPPPTALVSIWVKYWILLTNGQHPSSKFPRSLLWSASLCSSQKVSELVGVCWWQQQQQKQQPCRVRIKGSAGMMWTPCRSWFPQRRSAWMLWINHTTSSAPAGSKTRRRLSSLGRFSLKTGTKSLSRPPRTL